MALTAPTIMTIKNMITTTTTAMSTAQIAVTLIKSPCATP
jgi:hypothetical protein